MGIEHFPEIETFQKLPRKVIVKGGSSGFDAQGKPELRGIVINNVGHTVKDVRVSLIIFNQDEIPILNTSTSSEPEILPQGAILALNNRDIRVQECGDQSIEQSLHLRRLVLPPDFPAALVSASGIERPQDIAALVAAGFDAALVATALLQATDVVGFLQETLQLALQVRQATAVRHPVAA